jgi:hypothetical protein
MGTRVPDVRSPIQHHLVLHRIDPEQGVRRLCSLMIGRELVEESPTEVEAGQALEVIAQTKQRRGYQDL